MEMVRVNTRISAVLNNWLDEHSNATGIPKSTIVMLAIEQYKQQKEAMDKVDVMSKMLEKLEQMEKKLPTE